jgi:xanthine dehydrogenase YagS FAD-binding subunit
VPLGGDVHRLIGTMLERDRHLEPGEMITTVDLPPSPFGTTVHDPRIRNHASYVFARMSVAGALHLNGANARGCPIPLDEMLTEPHQPTLT